MKKSLGKTAAMGLLAALLLGNAQGGPLRDLLAQRAGGNVDAAAGENTMSAKGPFPLPAGDTAVRDVSYGSNAKELLDVYKPGNASGAPVLVMVHGGGWANGMKDQWRSVKNKVLHYLPKGYVVVSVGYPMIGDGANPLQQADSVAKAVAYVQGHAKEWGGDPSKVVLMGHSAGAHLVSLLSADPSIGQRAGVHPWLGTVSLDSAAFNVVQLMEALPSQGRFVQRLYNNAFGTDHALWEKASPTLVLKGAPQVPMLLICSSQRDDSCSQAQGFADKAKAAGGKVSLTSEDLTHAQINDHVGLPGAYTDTVDGFLRSVAGK